MNTIQANPRIPLAGKRLTPSLERVDALLKRGRALRAEAFVGAFGALARTIPRRLGRSARPQAGIRNALEQTRSIPLPEGLRAEIRAKPATGLFSREQSWVGHEGPATAELVGSERHGADNRHAA